MRSKEQDFDGGYTDTQLMQLSKNNPFRNGRSAWATWESERTSFGKTFRKEIKYPKYLPLFFSSDHYVDMLTSFRDNEANPSYPLYFTWNKEKCSKLKENGVNAVHIRHPWMFYRRQKYRKSNKSGRGTLLFWPHSNEHLTVELDLSKIKQVLSGIPETYKPLSICLSSHDIQLGLVQKIRTLGYPIYTVGNVMDQRFVDRFYMLIDKFKYTAGFSTGSHVYYLHEYGIPYLAFDYALVKTYSHGSTAIDDGEFDLIAKDYPDSNQRKTFDSWYEQLKTYSESVSIEQMEFAAEQLGCNSHTSIWKVRKLVYLALLKNIHKIPGLYLAHVRRLIDN